MGTMSRPPWQRGCGLRVRAEPARGAEGMVTKDSPLTVHDVIGAARKQTGRRAASRTPAYEWLWDRHDALAPELNPPRKPNWNAVAAEFEAKGIHGRDGPISARALRKAWLDVTRHKQLAASDSPPSNRRQQKAGTISKQSPVAEMKQVVPDEDLPEDEFVLQLAGGPKTWPKKEDGDV